MRIFFCVICDVFKLKKGQLCLYCYKKVIFRESTYSLRYENGVPHYYLFTWTLQADAFCRRLVYFLKNKKVEFFKEWTGYFPAQINYKASRVGVVPMSSSKGKVNHAEELAVSLKKLMGLSCVLEVVSGDGVAQKRRTRKERLRPHGGRPLGLDCKWIFIDDVFVTGGTYNRVKSKMGTSPEAIITLFYRPLMEREDDNV